MVSISDAKASNARISQDGGPRTAVITGGTDGIGKATLFRLVETQLPIRVYVIGRNGDKHKPFLDQLRKSNSKADIIWLDGQLSLLAETKRVCGLIKERETSIDLLYMSTGFIIKGERLETSEGHSLSLSLGYYGRILTIVHLLPLLNASKDPRVVTILAGGHESSSIYLDDIDLKKPGHYTLPVHSRSACTYTTLSMLRLAQENPRVVFIHHYPGGVNTGVFKKAFGDRCFWWVLAAALAVAATSPEDAAEKIMYLLTSAKYGGKGVSLAKGQQPGLTMANTRHAGSLFLVNNKLQELQQEKVMSELNRMDAGNIVWRKTMETMKPYLA